MDSRKRCRPAPSHDEEPLAKKPCAADRTIAEAAIAALAEFGPLFLSPSEWGAVSLVSRSCRTTAKSKSIWNRSAFGVFNTRGRWSSEAPGFAKNYATKVVLGFINKLGQHSI